MLLCVNVPLPATLLSIFTMRKLDSAQVSSFYFISDDDRSTSVYIIISSDRPCNSVAMCWAVAVGHGS